ncbi:hypothetical protein [Methanosarcina barkeri]|uniref:Uncharacterized protein n=2 Tax=Methanosarcina barkeri TaxID=2208 RepID=A0A0G3CFJ2_METBA|nr:hypothetical protein [Methanosarcina barkeri]AKB58720.1 hypothetical protein MSBR2_2204 [Methanosarcina barkeri 227]AKJ39530.1 hypothetical protein MCM1_2517 [Methanosarcina barkeri CM1]
MTSTKSCEVRCTKCKKWFCSQIIQFEDEESFLHSIMYKNTEECPYCKTMVTHDKEIMRFVEKDSNGKVIKETRYLYDF